MTSIGTPLLWIGFNVFVLAMLALDLGVFHKDAHAVSFKEAGLWSVLWISLSLVFNLLLYVWQGSEVGVQFLTGYLIEKSLSIDNIFVFVLIFGAMAVPAVLQHRVLFWGILGALVMRGVMIAAGASLLERFHWIIYIFGAFLVFTGIKIAFHQSTEVDPQKNLLVRLARRWFPVTADYEGQRFMVKQDGRRLITPLLLVLLMIESTDVVFALDSIPAIFAVTTDPFIVYTSNIFAILGLRSLYFLLAGSVARFRYLNVGLAGVLVFVGAKMLASNVIHISSLVSLGIITLLLGAAVVASLWRERQDARHAGAPPEHGRAA